MNATAYQSEAIDQLATALAGAQAEIENPLKDRENPHFRSKYADLASVLNAARGPLAKHGLSVVQAVTGDYATPMLRTTLLHKSGQYILGEIPLIGDIAKPQALGSLITYARRYTLAAIVGVAQEDDDGEAASPPNGNGYRGAAASTPPRRDAAPAPRPENRPAPRQSPQGGGQSPLDFPAPDMSRGKPSSGKGMWAWSKGATEATNYNWTDFIVAAGKRNNLPGKTFDWTREDIDVVWAEVEDALAGRPDVAPQGAGQGDEDMPF